MIKIIESKDFEGEIGESTSNIGGSGNYKTHSIDVSFRKPIKRKKESSSIKEIEESPRKWSADDFEGEDDVYKMSYDEYDSNSKYDYDDGIRNFTNRYVGRNKAYAENLDEASNETKETYIKTINNTESKIDLVKLLHKIRSNKGLTTTDKKELETKIKSKVK